MSQFGTNDVIYVPEQAQLVFDDVYHWRRYKLDVRHFGLRLHAGAFEEVTGAMRAVLELVQDSPRFADVYTQIRSNAEQMIQDMASHSGYLRGEVHSSLTEVVRGIEATWWVHLTDLPVETFFPEDYEHDLAAPSDRTPHPTFGLVKIAQLDGLEVGLAGDEKDEEGEKILPFAIDVPAQGLTRWTMPPLEPLNLIHEFCGTHGASSRGATINVDTHGKIAESHQFCTPLGKLGEHLYATLYIHVGGQGTEKIMGPLKEQQVMPTAELLEASGFRLHNEGPSHRIYVREGDVVHLYCNLAGKETEGVETMAPFLVVASAAGQYDPMHRAELFEAIRDSIRRMK